ncbi:MAG: hypothetical protein OXG35_20635, partial [Acidobacteria bacterium]|nr:hypothetical protein [Acidobacteriota bacterium]
MAGRSPLDDDFPAPARLAPGLGFAEEMTGMSVQSTPGGEDAWSAWQTEIERTMQRVRNIGELVAESNEPAVGQSP